MTFAVDVPRLDRFSIQVSRTYDDVRIPVAQSSLECGWVLISLAQPLFDGTLEVTVVGRVPDDRHVSGQFHPRHPKVPGRVLKDTRRSAPQSDTQVSMTASDHAQIHVVVSETGSHAPRASGPFDQRRRDPWQYSAGRAQERAVCDLQTHTADRQRTTCRTR